MALMRSASMVFAVFFSELNRTFDYTPERARPGDWHGGGLIRLVWLAYHRPS
jgi:hypothetical protein